MKNYTKKLIFIIQLLLIFTLAGCSKMAMYETGRVVKLIPIIGGPIGEGLKIPQEQENRRIAEENRRRTEIENQRKQAEYARWFNSLPKKEQVKIRMEKEKTNRERLRAQSEQNKVLTETIKVMFGPKTYIVY